MGGNFLKILSSCAGIAFPLNSFLEAIRKATCWAGREWKSLEPGEGEGSPADNKNRKETVTSDIPQYVHGHFKMAALQLVEESGWGPKPSLLRSFWKERCNANKLIEEW